MTDKKIDRTNILFTLSAVTGTGKTTVANRALACDKWLKRIVSYTTRPLRPGEVDGDSYHFVSEEQYRDMQKAGRFCENAKVYNAWYGVCAQDVMKGLEDSDVLLVVDWQGARTLSQWYSRVVKIFLLPPSVDALKERIASRDGQAPHVKERFAMIADEIQKCKESDYIVMNDYLDKAVADVLAIVHAERMKRQTRLPAYQGIVDGFLDPDAFS